MTMSLCVRTSVCCVVLCGAISCIRLWHIGDEDTMQSYAMESVRANKDMASRLCGADRRASVLYGVFSTADKVLWRNTTRQQVQCHLNSNVHNTVFVVGAVRTEREHTILKRESAMYGDIFTLSCMENMNLGKSYTYFKEALEQFPCFDFYAKVDDDTAFVPDKLSTVVQSASRSSPVIIGRYEAFPQANDPLFIVGGYVVHGLRDMSWVWHIQKYTAGCLYILNAVAVKRWISLNPTQVYGPEDMRTTYFMQIIRAEVINVYSAFHNHIRSHLTGTSHYEMRAPITETSLAVHECKTIELLLDAFASLCRM